MTNLTNRTVNRKRKAYLSRGATERNVRSLLLPPGEFDPNKINAFFYS